MTLIAAAPPGPVAGQPGHFAHSNWVEASLKLLALPLPVSTYAPTGVSGSTASFILNCDAVVVNPDPAKLLIVEVFGQSQMTVSAGLTAVLNSTAIGATVIAAANRGDEGRCAVGGGTMTLQFVARQLLLNPGTTTLRLMGGVAAGSGSQTFSFNKITVVPVGWQ